MAKSTKMQVLLSMILSAIMVFSLIPFGISSFAASIKTGDVTVKNVGGSWVSVSNKTGKKVTYTGVAKNQFLMK